ncbi:MAG TPA: Gfo/Idh/MocA family oxidoreductase [Tepidisphaeraceae bacterium]|nr:Gfo/Idh/MocA family oxidoreductase [Tepidisphaeraceae bacterium]
MNKTISVGVIGIGFGQQVHVPAFRSDPRCEIQSICATTEDRAKKAAQQLGIPQSTADAMALINDPAIQVVSVAVPPSKQPALIEAAARAGKHLFCEKPVGTDLAAASKAWQAVQASGVKHAIDFIFPEIPAWRQARELLPTLGKLRHVAISWRVETYAYKAGLSSWKTRGEDGGGTLGNFVSHSAYYIEWLFGPITKLTARLTGPADPQRSEARVDSWMELTGNLPVSLSVAADAYLGSGHRVEIYGDGGSVQLINTTADYVNGFELLIGGRDKAKLVQRAAPVKSNVDGRIEAASRIVKRLIDSVNGGEEVTPNLSQGIRVQKLLDAMRESHNTRQWQNV